MQSQLCKLPSSSSPHFYRLNRQRGDRPTVTRSPFLQVYIAPLMLQRLGNQGNNNVGFKRDSFDREIRRVSTNGWIKDFMDV